MRLINTYLAIFLVFSNRAFACFSASFEYEATSMQTGQSGLSGSLKHDDIEICQLTRKGTANVFGKDGFLGAKKKDVANLDCSAAPGYFATAYRAGDDYRVDFIGPGLTEDVSLKLKKREKSVGFGMKLQFQEGNTCVLRRSKFLNGASTAELLVPDTTLDLQVPGT